MAARASISSHLPGNGRDSGNGWPSLVADYVFEHRLATKANPVTAAYNRWHGNELPGLLFGSFDSLMILQPNRKYTINSIICRIIIGHQNNSKS
jgi:hypothetical protein